MKKVIKKALKLLGIKLILLKSRKVLPAPNIDNIEIVVRFYQMMGKRISLLQIGACDGETSDSINRYVKAGNIDAYLVEPSKVNFAKLESYYRISGTQATLINAAIADADGKRSFYSIKDEGRWKDKGWARQLASFYKSHLLKHGILEHEILEEEVDCMTVKTVLQKHQLNNLDVLVIDTEGYDGEIVKMVLDQNILPVFIAFENVQLLKLYSQKQLDELYNLLASKGYVWTQDRINTMAIRKDFFHEN